MKEKEKTYDFDSFGIANAINIYLRLNNRVM